MATKKKTTSRSDRLKAALRQSTVGKSPAGISPVARWKWRRTNPLSAATLQKFGRQRAFTRDKSKYQYGPELREAIARGDIPSTVTGKKKKTPRTKGAASEMLQSQRKSPLLVETIRRQLTGDRVGRALPTDTEVRELVDLLAGVKPSKLTALREGIAERLTKKSSWLRRQLSQGAVKGIGAVQSVLDLATKAVNKLIGADTLKKQLAGLDLRKREATAAPETGVRQTTPYQRRRMVGVKSSNVAAVGWEPHTQGEPPTQNTLGTLFIDFKNGWSYKYADCPYWVFQALLRASSPGRAVWALIRRGLYPDGVPYGSLDVEGYQRIR